MNLNFRPQFQQYIAKKGRLNCNDRRRNHKDDTTVTGGDAIAEAGSTTVAKGQVTAIATDGSTVIVAGNKITTTTADGTTTTEKLNKE